jgi:hypothetical protein
MLVEKPERLPEVWSLPAHLEMQELFRVEVLLTASLKTDFVIRIIGFNEIFNDCARFPKCFSNGCSGGAVELILAIFSITV